MPGSCDRCSGTVALNRPLKLPPDLAWVSRGGNSAPIEDLSPLRRHDVAALTRMWPPITARKPARFMRLG
jgi:hypothetical protein